MLLRRAGFTALAGLSCSFSRLKVKAAATWGILSRHVVVEYCSGNLQQCRVNVH